MTIRKIANGTFKIAIAGIIAFFVLNIICLVYYLVPGHTSSKSEATDYVYPEYAPYSIMLEGYGHGQMNNEGLNNLGDFNGQPIDILIMGSSHMEGCNVAQTETASSILNDLFNQESYIYNIAFSTHEFLRNAYNLEKAITHYQPRKYVVFEIQNLDFTIRQLEDVIFSRMTKLPSFDHGLLSTLQKFPYLRLGYRQIKFFTGLHVVDTLAIFNDDSPTIDTDDSNNNTTYSELLDSVMERISLIAANHGIKLIVFRHPRLTLNENGTASVDSDNKYVRQFRKACSDNGIYFLDMAEPFMREYKSNYILPHGFFNTAVGVGHLNKNGHKTVAYELFKYMNEISRGDI
jgi:hypothetical protein